MLTYETADNLLDVSSEYGFSTGIFNDAEGRYDLPAGQLRVSNTQHPLGYLVGLLFSYLDFKDFGC